MFVVHLIEKLRSDDRIDYISETTTLHVNHILFFLHFFASLHDYDAKMPYFTFYGGRKQATIFTKIEKTRSHF